MKREIEKAAALKYEHGKDNAPTVVAKGQGKVAESILDIARKHGVPIREDRDLVEFLSALDLYQEIPHELYKAVAEILVFVYGLRNKS